MTSEPDLVNVREASKILKVEVSTVRTMIRTGKLKAYRFGKEYRMYRQAVYDLIDFEKDKNEDSRIITPGEG